MSAFPTSPRAAFVQWCEVHAPVFVDNAAAIGLTDSQAEAFKDATSAVAEAILAQEQALQAYRVATRAVEEALLELRGGAGESVRLIRAFAESQSQTEPPTVYNTAQIAPPARPSPAPPPAKPTSLSVSLGASDGSLTLRWKAANPDGTSGTAYIIRRKLPGEPGFSFIGVSGRKQFVDDSVSFGSEAREGIHAPAVQYTVQGQRADVSGPLSEILTVNFGRLPDSPVAVALLASSGTRLTPSTRSMLAPVGEHAIRKQRSRPTEDMAANGRSHATHPNQ